MKLPIAAAAVFLAATAAMPAFAAARAPGDGAMSAWRYGYHAYAAAPSLRSQWVRSWGHCASGDSSMTSAYPSWDVCRGH
jgi:hypothetical protein